MTDHCNKSCSNKTETIDLTPTVIVLLTKSGFREMAPVAYFVLTKCAVLQFAVWPILMSKYEKNVKKSGQINSNQLKSK